MFVGIRPKFSGKTRKKFRDFAVGFSCLDTGAGGLPLFRTDEGYFHRAVSLLGSAPLEPLQAARFRKVEFGDDRPLLEPGGVVAFRYVG